MIDDWSRFKNFEQSEFACSHCKKCEMHPDIVEIVQEIRTRLDKPLFISSGYRCVNHPIETMKDKPGEHTRGMAVDVIAYGQTGLFILGMALQLGIRRIGMHQKGRASGRFIHLGIADKHTNEFSAALWTY